MSESIIVAVIGTVGVVLASLIQVLRKENKTDHAAVVEGMARIETKIDGHIGDHARGDL
ncbi:hypothetical protein UFOVP625_40 [uncultured Caudovirales phage]|uniref:Uncharacterized protein n=1 Tax=uncultured Caudovirales phage TaxID=2100421 RepID=A0A6J5N562_9CAUD|nr:hypothetical protein UFOVP625_40 [uncultured Caudovirales phage]